MNATTANSTSANASTTSLKPGARVPLTRKVFSSRSAKGELVRNGVSYRTPVELQGTTLDVSVDLNLGYTWFSCNHFSGLGCTKACTNVTEGCINAASATFQLGDATVANLPADFAQGPMYADGVKSAFSGAVAWPTPRSSKFVDRLSSFSLFLASDQASSSGAKSFLMLNGMDDALVAQNKLTPITVPLTDIDTSRNYKLSMTAFQVGQNNSAALYPCSRYSRSTTSSGCTTRLTTSLSHIQMPIHIFDAFARKYFGYGCTGMLLFEQHMFFNEFANAYVCPRSLELPRLALTFGKATFYLDGKDYVSPHPDDATKVIVELTGRGIEWDLGAKFFEKFYTSFAPRANVTLYCRSGDDCGVNIVKNPASPPGLTWELQDYEDYASAYLRDSAPAGASDLVDKKNEAKSTSASSAGVIIGVLVAVVLVIAAAFGAWRFMARKRKAAATTVEISTPAAADDLS